MAKQWQEDTLVVGESGLPKDSPLRKVPEFWRIVSGAAEKQPGRIEPGVCPSECRPLRPNYRLRILPAKREKMPSGAEIAFNPEYIPLLASERRVRANLLAPWNIIPLEDRRSFVAPFFIDPFVAAELRSQEKREAPFPEALTATVGRKNANWRAVLYWEARKSNPQAKAELDALFKGADARESRLFHEASVAIDEGLFRQKPWDRTKLHAILWTLEYFCKYDSWPTRPMVKAALKEMGCNFPGSEDGKNDRRFFTGPVLGRILLGDPGAPRGPRRKQ